MQEKIIKKSLSSKVIMAGNYYKHHHPGGISAVVDYWSRYIEDLQYYPTFKESNQLVKRGLFFISYLRMLFRMLLDKNIRIVHLHTAADGSFWRKVQLVKLGKFWGRKVVLHVHASRFKDFYSESSKKRQEWIRRALLSVDVLVVLSNSWKDWFKQIGIPEDKIVVLHNITAYPTDIPSAKVDDGKVHFLFMGEIGQRKGVFDILRAMSKHRDELLGKIELRIGGNRNEEQLKKMINDNHLEDMVVFEGWVGGEKKLRLLNWADVFILPSFNEGLPISILEAMSYKMPIISTNVGGIPEVVENGRNGILVRPGNDEEIYRAMKHYIDKPAFVALEGVKSAKIVESYLPDRVMNNLKNIYEKLLF